MPLPDFLCIGAQKSATTWLYKMLAQHPDVWMSPVKELHFFDRLAANVQRTRGRHRQLGDKQMKLGAEKGLGDEWTAYLERVVAFDGVSEDWYREVFSWPVREGAKRGDITPAYLEIPERTVAYARELLGDIKIMVIVRRPLDRELSQLRMWATRKSLGLPPPETEQDWMGLYDLMLKAAPRGSYSHGIPLWQAAFSKENFIAIPFADIREAPLMTMKRIEDFLDVPSFGLYRMLDKQVHKTAKAIIPQAVTDRAAERVAEEDSFIKRHFGEEFFARTK